MDVEIRVLRKMKDFLNSCFLANVYDTMTDQELAEHLLEDVWGEVSITSPQAAILESAIDRLRRSPLGALASIAIIGES